MLVLFLDGFIAVCSVFGWFLLVCWVWWGGEKNLYRYVTTLRGGGGGRMVREEKTQDTETGNFNDIDKEILIVLQGAPSGLTIKDLANSLGIKTFLEARRIWDLIRWYEFKAALKRLAEKGIIEKGSEDRIKLRSIEKP
ncbi:MAG: hypothetical protein DRO11_07460, partial [Methanobacteriota archaeon]